MIKETKTNLPIDEAIYEQGYNQAIKDLDNFDWQAFRREAAKDILAGMLSAPARISIGGKRLETLPDFTKAAVKLADELIKQLQMGEK